MTASMPSAVPTTANLRGDLVDNLATTLSGALSAIATTINVDDTTSFPTAGLASVRSASGSGSIELFSYTGKTASSFTGVTRNFNSRYNSAWNEDDVVELLWAASHHNRHAEETIAIAQNIVDRFGTGTNIVVPAARTFTIQATSNQLILGTTRTVTFSAPTPASSSRTITFPDLSGDYSVIGTIGAQTITGAKTFADQTLLLQETGGADVVTINVAALAASRAYTIPEAGASASFIMTAGAQTITGAKTFADQTLKLQETGSTDVVTINVAALAASRAYTLFDAGADATFVMSAGAQTIGGAKSFSEVILSANGTNSLPTFSFISDPDTGMYRAGANSIGITTGGVARWTVDSGGMGMPLLTTQDTARSILLTQCTLGSIGAVQQYSTDALTTAKKIWDVPAGCYACFVVVTGISSGGTIFGDVILTGYNQSSINVISSSGTGNVRTYTKSTNNVAVNLALATLTWAITTWGINLTGRS